MDTLNKAEIRYASQILQTHIPYEFKLNCIDN